jgi:DNA topoisomerase-2
MILAKKNASREALQRNRQKMWVFDAETTQFVQKEIEFIPALYKIYDEILVNAADNKVRDPGQNMIKVFMF